MCGIAGTARIGDLTLVEKMTALMAYRGPDDYGLYEDGEVRLGHRRLSILDVSAAGHQPMQTDDGQLVITFNGAIYNYRQLRAELEKQGHRFHTGTDTETILYAYREYGRQFVDRLEGMFAFALWDRQNRQLLLARDRIGIKPLFYYQRGNGLAFASELKALLYVPGLERRVNRRALRSAIRYASNIEDEAMIASVFKLRPGHFLVWRDGVCEQVQYWSHPSPRPEAWDEQGLTKVLREKLAHVVRSHTVSDVPLGVALSGGLDSSGIVALLAQQNGGGKVDTFTVGHGTDDPDVVSARLVAEHCRTNHHEIIVSAENIADLTPRVVWHLEEPLGQMETVQMYVNYREAARFVKVLLIGEGADECFGGYERYKLLSPWLPLPFAVSKDLYERVYQHSDGSLLTNSGRAITRLMWGKAPVSPLVDSHPRAGSPSASFKQRSDAIACAMNYDQRTLLPHLYLKRADGLGMAHSLELRVPFLDRQIVELAARIPGSMMVHGRTEKYVLRRALAPFLPPKIAWRRKHPQQMQVNKNLVETLEYLSDQLLRPADVRARGFFAPALVEDLRRQRPKPFSGSTSRKFWSWRIWSMILSELWARMFLDRPISSEPPESLADLL
jgi:asparagine synthase (glutamine-hydrolysing)